MTDEKYKNFLDACADCIVACKNCAAEDLKEDDIEMMSRAIKLNHDCAAVCILAMQAIASESEFINQICALSAEICIVCAVENSKYSYMEQNKLCEEACRKCAEECEKIK